MGSSYTQKKSFVDYHTHILPGMDDGSRSVEESLEMLRASAAQNVGCVVLTPHFYALHDHPQRFLERRERSVHLLQSSCTETLPSIIPAAEVAYFEGITEMAELLLMRVGESRSVLIEMPQREWTTRMVEDILDIQNRRDFSVVIAHLDRYAAFQSESVLARLVENGVKMQANAESFYRPFVRRKTIHLLKKGFIHLLGSDCHNLTSRPPNLLKAVESIASKCGSETVEQLLMCGEEMIAAKPVIQGAEKER